MAEKYDHTKDLWPISHGGCACVACATGLKPGDLHLDCPDCGAIFCESCVQDGTFEGHKCEDYDWDDDQEEV